MDFILDNKESDKNFQKILTLIKSRRSGEVSESMQKQGIKYKTNWGVSIIDLREISKMFEPNHLLALKLWNKQWRETMIMATFLDEPEEISEEQMDFWTKSFENTEIAEQASFNLWVKSKYAFVKALEWCRGKKHIIRYTGIHLMGRLAISDKKAIDEMFEPFFEEIQTLAKDSRLFTPLYRSILAVGTRSISLNKQTIELSKELQLSNSDNALKLGEELFEELTNEFIKIRFVN